MRLLHSSLSDAQQLIGCNCVGFKGWFAFWQLLQGRVPQNVCIKLMCAET